MRYFLHIAYDGHNYRGWQRLPGIVSVQGVIEAALGRILKTPVAIVGCGRTDAQVHASQFFFHFDLEGVLCQNLLFLLNKNLPHDITVFDVVEMKGLPHARFDAVNRCYDYFIHTQKDPYLNSLSSYYQASDLNIKKMNEAVGLLINYNDYRSFCKSPLKYEHTICKVSDAQLFADIYHTRARFHISSNRFLAGMIRIIVGKLLEIGYGELTVNGFEQYLKNKVAPKTIMPAYPQGLYLTKVTYPYLDLPNRSVFGRMLINGLVVPV